MESVHVHLSTTTRDAELNISRLSLKIWQLKTLQFEPFCPIILHFLHGAFEHGLVIQSNKDAKYL